MGWRALYLIAGSDDSLVHVTARDVENLQQAVLGGLTVRPEVMSVRTNLTFQAWQAGPTPATHVTLARDLVRATDRGQARLRTATLPTRAEPPSPRPEHHFGATNY